jgi:hypothetical protein
VFINAVEWFDKCIFEKAVGVFVLQDSDGSVADTWDKVIEAWHGQDYLAGGDHHEADNGSEKQSEGGLYQ